MRIHIISDMEGVSGIVKWEQTTGGEKMYDEGRRLYTEEINAAVRGAKAAGANEIVVMDCHGAGGAWSFNSLIPDLLDPACEFVVQDMWTEYTGFLEEGCDAALFVGMHAMAGTPRRRDEPHRVGPAVAEPVVQRDAGRRDGDQRRAVRAVGMSRPARDRRRRRMPRGEGAARRRTDDGRRQEGAQQLQRPTASRPACPRAHRGGSETGARGPEGGRAVRPRASLRRSKSSSRSPKPPTASGASRASSGSTRATSSPAPTTGGQRGASSSSETISSSSMSVKNAVANGDSLVRSRTLGQSTCSRSARAISRIGL